MTLTGTPAAFARADIATPMSPALAQKIAITPPRSAVSGSPTANSILAASAPSKPSDARAGRNQQAQLRPHQFAAADEQDGAILQIEEYRQESHSLPPPHLSGLTGIIFYIFLFPREQRENYFFSIAVQL
jgi:hypothetical protein